MKSAVSFALATVLAAAPWLASCSTLRSDRQIFPSIDGLQQVPEPGDILEDLPERHDFVVYGSGGASYGYTAVIDGITFTVSVHAAAKRKYRVDYVFTRDPRFVTPEGAKCGDTLASLFDRNTSQLVTPSGFSAYVRLPSGWCAAFENVEFNLPGEMVEIEITSSSEIAYFFKR
jgi:hypothetical protein